MSEPLSLFAVTAPGLENLTAAELRAMGIGGTVEAGGVAWSGDIEQLYAANLRLRTASRVLLRVGEFGARTFPELERRTRRIHWDRFVSVGAAVDVRVTSRKSRLYHQRAVAQRIVDAIGHRVGAVSSAHTGAGGADGEAAGQLVVVRLVRDVCAISIDSSGETCTGADIGRRWRRRRFGRPSPPRC